LQDVVHLAALRDELTQRLEQRERMAWLMDETRQWQQGIVESDARPRWTRVAGISGLRPQSLAIVKHLWQWREAEAQRRDCPPKRILRDDLLVELARRRKHSIKSIRAIRGLDRRHLSRYLEDISECIAVAMDAPPENFERPTHSRLPKQIALISQFLNAALTSICRSNEIAPTIVATVQDIRDLIAHHMGLTEGAPPPALATGWRSDFIGRQMEELLDGEKAIRIVDLTSPKPLEFQPLN
jgi:ribonuclease D